MVFHKFWLVRAVTRGIRVAGVAGNSAALRVL